MANPGWPMSYDTGQLEVAINPTCCISRIVILAKALLQSPSAPTHPKHVVIEREQVESLTTLITVVSLNGPKEGEGE